MREQASKEVVARPRNIFSASEECFALPRNVLRVRGMFCASEECFARPSPIQVNPIFFISFERLLMVHETF